MAQNRSARWGLLALIVVSVLAALGWFWQHRSAAAAAYRTAQADRGPIRIAIAATGNLKAVTTVDIGSQVSGQVRTVEGDYNMPVRKDQPIAHLDPATFQARVTQAEADLASAEASRSAARANLADTEATLKNAQRDLERKREIRARGLIAQVDLDSAELLRDQAMARRGSSTAQIAVADAQVKQRQAALANANLDLQRSVIRAPIDGVIVMRNVQPGQTVAASFQTPVLFQIAEDLTQMELNLSIDEADVGQVREGQRVRFGVDAFPNRDFQGRVKQIRLAAVTTQNVVTYPVVVAVDNADLTLLPGMTANAEIEVGGNADALRVPNAAVRFKPPEGQAPAATAQGGGARGGMDWDGLKARLKLDATQSQAFDGIVKAMRERQQAQRAARSAEGAPSGRESGGAGAGGTGEPTGEQRSRMSEGIRKALAPLREQLSEAQRATLDEELAALANARRGVLWTLDGGALKAVPVRFGSSDDQNTEVLGDAIAPGTAVVVGLNAAGT